jgi:hypothetical protein
MMRAAIDRLVIWSNKWQLKISTPKTFTLHLGKKNMKAQYIIDAKPIAATTTICDLGIQICASLSFEEHIIIICKKAAIRANMIPRAFRSNNRTLLYRAFIVYVRPMLEYCTETWNPQQSKSGQYDRKSAKILH